MLTYDLEKRGELGLYEYLYRCIKRDIECGRIVAHEKLPSKRTFAQHLGVSLITVEGAYAQLEAEGYIYAKPRRGYYAMDLPADALRKGSLGASASASDEPEGSSSEGSLRCEGAKDSLAYPDDPEVIADFSRDAAVASAHVRRMWARSLREAVSKEHALCAPSALPAEGSERLRCAIACHLRTFRTMEVDPSCIIVGAGAQVLYNMIVQLLGRKCVYAVETPGYERLTSIYRANDVEVRHIGIDAFGADVRDLRASGAQVAHLMPSHQFPTGIVMSASRRYELLAWAAQSPDRYIVEDDYDCEFRLAGRPIPSLQSVDALGKVIYTNTFAKSLGPDVRVAYMVLPPDLMVRFREHLGFYSSTVGSFVQDALASIIASGDFERHVNRVRTKYRAIRDEIVAKVKASELSSVATVENADAGLHFLLRIDADCSEERIARQARREGVVLSPLGSYCHAKPPSCAVAVGGEGDGDCGRLPARFVMHYSGVDPDRIDEAVGALCRAVRRASSQ